MPDIAMCIGTGCKDRKTCYRHRAIPSMRQSYFGRTPAELKDTLEDDVCIHYVEVRKTDKLAPYEEDRNTYRHDEEEK